MGGITKRMVEVGTDTCLLGFSGRAYIESAAFDASSLSAVGGVNEIQTVTVTGSPTGGTFTLKYRGQETATIAFNGTAAAVQTALRALSNIGSGGVSVAGSSGGPYTVTFTGILGNTDVYMLQLGTNALTGGTTPSVTVVQTTQGVNLDPRIMVGTPTKPGTIVTTVGSNPKRVKEFAAASGVAEVQTITITGTPTGGTFTLNYKGEVTTPIAFNATAAVTAAALNALESITAEGGVVGGGGAFPGTPVTITFNNRGARPLLSAVSAGLTGGTTPTVTPAETTAGADSEAIFGVIDGVEEFITNAPAGDKDVAVYVTQCVFNTNKIKNYSTYQAEFDAWCRANFNKLRAV